MVPFESCKVRRASGFLLSLREDPGVKHLKRVARARARVSCSEAWQVGRGVGRLPGNP